MEIAIALLFSVSIGCIVYMIITKKKTEELLTQRIKKNMATSPFPYTISNKTKQSPELILKNPHWDKKSKKMFKAGVRGKKSNQIHSVLNLLSVIAPVLMIVFCFLTGSLNQKAFMTASIVGVVFFMISRFSIKMAITNRKRKIVRLLPQFLDLLVVCVEAGLGFTAALERVLKELPPKEPLTQEFSLMYSEFLSGLSLGETAERLEKRIMIPDLSVLLSGIVQSDQMGTSLGKDLRIQGEDLRDKFRQRMRTKAFRIPVMILGPVVLVFMNVFIITLGPVLYRLKSAFQ